MVSEVDAETALQVQNNPTLRVGGFWCRVGAFEANTTYSAKPRHAKGEAKPADRFPLPELYVE
jgi:hypothetical protein